MNTLLWNRAARLFGGMIVLLAILTLVLFLHSTAPKAPTAPTSPAAVAMTQNKHPNLGVPGVSYRPPVGCEPDPGYSCTPGYTGTNATGWAWSFYGCPKQASGCSAGTPHNCTLYVAFRLMQNGVTLNWYDDAKNWSIRANSSHVPVDQTPAVGAIAQWNSGISGHVAYVEASDASGITITMDDYYTSQPWPNGYTARVHIAIGSPAWPDNFIHFQVPSNPGQPAFYAGKIVQWNGDTKTQRTSWLVTPDLKRYWIPDISTYNCLKGNGFADAGPISSTLLDQLPDQSGQWATCGNRSLGNNQFLFRGSYLRSSNGLYILWLQRSDGNLVLYGPSGPIWANSRSADYLVLQADGNLVAYSYGAGVTWATGTVNTRANAFVVQDDGKLVLSAPGGVKIWESSHGSPSSTPPSGPTVISPQGPTVTPMPTTMPTSPSSGPTVTPTSPPPGPTMIPTPIPPKTYAEQEGHHGANTFTDPFNASGMGAKIPAAAWVQVVCKVYAPQIQSANPDGYWYLIASSPWNSAYYAVANTFMNGDPWNGPYTHNTDFNVPNC